MAEGGGYRVQVSLPRDVRSQLPEPARWDVYSLYLDDETRQVSLLLPGDVQLEDGTRQSLVKFLKDRFPEASDHRVILEPEADPSALVDWLRDHWDLVKQDLTQWSTSFRSLLEYARPATHDEGVTVELAQTDLVAMARQRNLDDALDRWCRGQLGRSVSFRLEHGDFQDRIENDARTFREQEAEEQQRRRQRQKIRSEEDEQDVVMGDEITSKPTPLDEFDHDDEGTVTVEGKVITVELVETDEDKKNIVDGVLSDGNDSLRLKDFPDENSSPLTDLEGQWIRAKGRLDLDQYNQPAELCLIPNHVNVTSPRVRDDTANRKRVEFHCHTNMSQMDGLADVEELVERAAKWDHPALAITDHGVGHSFPEAAHAAEEYGVKIIYGVEGYLVPEQRPMVINGDPYANPDQGLMEGCVLLDCETTGVSPQLHEPYHVSALRIRDGEVAEEFDSFISVSEIDERILDQSPVSREEILGAREPEQVFDGLAEFLGEDPVVCYEGHFVRNALSHAGFSFRGPVIHMRRLVEDTWEPTTSALNELAEGRFDLSRQARFDAAQDVRHSWKVLQQLVADQDEPLTVAALRERESETDVTASDTHHIILLARNQTGLQNLYQLISESHVEDFYRRPRMKRSLIEEHRDGLLIGSACESGEVFQKVLEGAPREEIHETMKFYDVIEVQPVENNRFMINADGAFESVQSLDDIREMTRTIYELGSEIGKPVVGTGDVHFVDEQDEVYRRVLQHAQGFSDPDDQPPLYLRTSDEMLDAFSFLGSSEAREVAVENPQQVADLCDSLEPIPDEFSPPRIEGAEQEFTERINNRLEELYGPDPPDFVRERLEAEREAIIENQFSNLYVMASWMVDQSKEDGYLVGSRGSVGSSFAAYLMEITEVNPLAAHYRCRECCYVEKSDDPGIVGVDLEPKDCPDCGTPLERDGYKIPFEVFLGFEGDKIPDIDLNFSGEYQPEMFRFVRDYFGEENVFRAGTISTIAGQTAKQFVNDYFEERRAHPSPAEQDRLCQGIVGVKRTTGQHPGGMIIVPEDRSIYEFTPINLPANDREAEFQTTHFEYHAMEEQLVKLDILGHDDPTQLRHLEELTGVDPTGIPLDDQATMSLFSGVEALDLEADNLGVETGVLGIPEFNTGFVRRMVAQTRPKTFADLLRISGLSHGDGVWQGNAQLLIEEGFADLDTVISCRDDIMNTLIDAGLPERKAFQTMEDVRKGRDLDSDQERAMEGLDIPDWYVKSCKRIGYLFPKAHAAAYVIMAFRIAYYKVHHPTAFYASYFSLKATDLNAQYLNTLDQVDERMRSLKQLMREGEHTPRDQTEYSVLEVVREAYLRGISIKPPKISKSNPERFTVIDDDTLRASFRTVEGMGGTVAEELYRENQEESFLSIEDAENRTGLNKAIREEAEAIGFFEDLPESDTVDLFEG